MMGQYRRGNRISPGKARTMIMMMAKHGDHSHGQFNTDAEVKEFFKVNGVKFDALISKVRDGGTVTFLENILGSTFHTSMQSTGTARTSVTDATIGQEIAGFDGPGFVSLSASNSRFESAVRRVTDAMERHSAEDMISAVESGVASVEGFIAERVSAWNRANPNDMLIDNAANKVPFNVKIEQWIPKIAGGKRINKGSTNYQDFAKLKKYRDDYGAHIKDEAHAISSENFVKNIDTFRTGIAGTLVDLHILFGMRVPGKMIREYHSADVVMIGS